MTTRQFALTGGLGLLAAAALLITGAALDSTWLQVSALVPLAFAAAAKAVWTYGPRDVLLAAALVAIVLTAAFIAAVVIH